MVIRKKKESYMGEILDYLERNMSKGYSLESLKWALVQQGYSKLEVEKAMQQINKKLSIKPKVEEAKPEITYQSEPIIPEPEKKSFWGRLFG